MDEFARFIVVEEVGRFMKFFKTDINVFSYVEGDTCYKKQHSFVYLERAMFV
jgi:hypothetical protein